jgi:hypothetical protein
MVWVQWDSTTQTGVFSSLKLTATKAWVATVLKINIKKYITNKNKIKTHHIKKGNQCSMYYGAPYPCPASIGSTLGNGQGISSNGVNALVSDGCYYRLLMQGKNKTKKEKEKEINKKN